MLGRAAGGARAARHARLAWWNGTLARCSQPRGGWAARACLCAECSAGLLHSLLAGCAADLLGWRGVCAAATARGVPPRASRTVELRRAGRGALWCGMVPEAVCRRLQKAQTVSEVRCGARVEG